MSGVFGCEEPRGIAEKRFKVGLSMESKMHGFPYENDRFQVSLGARDSADSQK